VDASTAEQVLHGSSSRFDSVRQQAYRFQPSGPPSTVRRSSAEVTGSAPRGSTSTTSAPGPIVSNATGAGTPRTMLQRRRSSSFPNRRTASSRGAPAPDQGPPITPIHTSTRVSPNGTAAARFGSTAHREPVESIESRSARSVTNSVPTASTPGCSRQPGPGPGCPAHRLATTAM
jgi:hypothetical protein